MAWQVPTCWMLTREERSYLAAMVRSSSSVEHSKVGLSRIELSLVIYFIHASFFFFIFIVFLLTYIFCFFSSRILFINIFIYLHNNSLIYLFTYSFFLFLFFLANHVSCLLSHLRYRPTSSLS